MEDRSDEHLRPPAGVRTTRRRGRTSHAKETALRDLLPRWGVPRDGPWTVASLQEGTGHLGPCALDIGIGDGEATRAWAADCPELLIIALELHRPGLAKVLTALDAEGPSNVRVAEADAVEVLGSMEGGALVAIRVLFPDPWPKRRHVDRRLVDRAFVVAAANALAPGGALEVSTDWDDYAHHARTMIATEARFEVVAEGRPIARPQTVYERKGLAAGRSITDLVARRR